MENIHPQICFVIPPELLAKVAAQTDDKATLDARSTLAQMQRLTRERLQTAAALRPARKKAGPFRKRRWIYDGTEKLNLPGTRVMTEATRRSSDDDAVNEAFAGAGAVWNFFAEVFKRNSLDGAGMRIDSTVHYGQRFDNALWTGRQVVYGDGDGRWFVRFTKSLAVIGHELTHCVVQKTAGLGYTGETGALHEHLCDVFGTLVQQYAARTPAHLSRWLIGNEILGSAFIGKAIRSMADPGNAYNDPLLGKDPQVAHMRDYVETTEDNGGVHINSGILNYAFYRAARAIGGNAWEVPGKIWYVTMTSRLGPNASFFDFAQATVDVAGELFGIGSRIQRRVVEAWEAVGVFVPIFNSKQQQQRKEAA